MKGNSQTGNAITSRREQEDVLALPSLPEFWDALASFSFKSRQGSSDITRFFELDAIAQRSSRHEKLMSQFWDAAFDGEPRPARPAS